MTLLAELGHTGHVVRQEVRARAPSPAERDALALTATAPVLEPVRTTLDAAAVPFQVDVSVFPAATQRLRYGMRIS